MNPINSSQPPLSSSPISSIAKGSSASNEAAQMDYVLNLLYEIAHFANRGDIAMSIKKLKDTFAKELTQNLPPLQTMQDQLNQMINTVNGDQIATAFPPWDIDEDQKQPGNSFMNCMLSFSQFLDSESAQNTKIHDWVSNIGSYLNTGPWEAKSLFNFVSDFFKAANALGPNPNGITFPAQNLPSNIFE